MSEDVIPLRGFAFSMEQPATSKNISKACYQMYCEWHYSPFFVLMTKEDHAVLLQEVSETLQQQRRLPANVSLKRLNKIVNETTGRMMDVFVTEWLAKRVVIFGRYDPL